MRIRRRFLLVCLVVCGYFGAIHMYYKFYFEENYKDQIDSVLLKMKTEITKYPNEEYNVIPNLILSDIKRDASEISKLILITQTTISNLYQIGNLSSKWDGQISVSVFSFGSEITQVLHYIILLRKCFKDVRNKVSFHLLYPISQPPINLTSVYEMDFGCRLLSVLRAKHSSENFAKGSQYPVNINRNVALHYSVSDYVLYIDVDLSPSKRMKTEMETFLENNELNGSKKKQIYIVPSFETNSSFYDSLSKVELLKAVKNGSARPLSVNKCFPCHALTDFPRWLSLPYQSELNISYYVGFRHPYEPSFISSRQHYPPFDERFKGYGLDRFSQVCETYYKGIDLAVMNNAFVIHDGFKSFKTYYTWKIEENRRNFLFFNSTFLTDLRNRYPESKRKCM